MMVAVDSDDVRVTPAGLPGTLAIPQGAFGLVVFAHGSGSSRNSPRNRLVANVLNQRKLATLLFDLLRPEEEDANARAKVFDIPLLAERLEQTINWVDHQAVLKDQPIGLFGSSTGAAAALVAAVELRDCVGAVVSRGGRPDLVGDPLSGVQAPTLLIVGGNDYGVIELNQRAFERLGGPKEIVIVPHATHLFAEPGALETVVEHTVRWFEHFLRKGPAHAASR